MSDALYEEFLKPLLLVGLFELPEHLSAAAMIGTLYFYSARRVDMLALISSMHCFEAFAVNKRLHGSFEAPAARVLSR